MMTTEILRDDDSDATISLMLNGAENTILTFRYGTHDDTLSWGFTTVEKWRSFLKMCLRYDDRLGKTS